MASDINIGDILYDCEAEGGLIGWVAEKHRIDGYWYVEWNDGSRTEIFIKQVRVGKKEWHKLRKKCLTAKKK